MSMKHGDFMLIARIFAEKSTCQRRQVGAVLTMDRRIIATGYNGAPTGMAHCEHSADDGICVRAVHAESNAIAFSARHGVPTEDSVLYTTSAPCVACAQLIVNAGIRIVYYEEEYRLRDGIEILEGSGVQVRKLDQPRVQPLSSL